MGPPGDYRKGGMGPPNACANAGTQPAGLRHPRQHHTEHRPGGSGDRGVALPPPEIAQALDLPAVAVAEAQVQPAPARKLSEA
ncbi:UNVERIFIED_CONTAM: hypothetical protein K2H54_035924 [Gekko kuhli]